MLREEIKQDSLLWPSRGECANDVITVVGIT